VRTRVVTSVLAVAAVAVAPAGCGSGSGGAAAPAVPASRLETQAGRLLGGGVAAFRRQLAALKGTPVVVNQWASWCGPCRFEFPILAARARDMRVFVAFLGVDSNDSRADAQRFLRQERVPYPSFFDPDVSIGRTFRGGALWPTTAFYDATGKLIHTHVGPYTSAAQLDADIQRHAVDARP
jgi:cytochrome c biogenesis protein CcmG/thiol:disulfide interchange protein DsbE